MQNHYWNLDQVEISFSNPAHDYSINRPFNEKFQLPFDFVWPKVAGDAELMVNQIMIDLLNPAVMSQTNDKV